MRRIERELTFDQYARLLDHATGFEADCGLPLSYGNEEYDFPDLRVHIGPGLFIDILPEFVSHFVCGSLSGFRLRASGPVKPLDVKNTNVREMECLVQYVKAHAEEGRQTLQEIYARRDAQSEEMGRAALKTIDSLL